MAGEDLVNVKDPDTGEIGSIPSSQLAVAQQQGFAPATHEETSIFVRGQKYGGLGQQLATGLEGAASAATFGLSTGVEKALGVPEEDIRARREENPIAHGTGQVAGLVGSSLLIPGGGAAGAMELAGQGAARAVGLGAAEGTLARIGSSAVKAAVENTIFQAGDEVSKALMNDPDQSLGNVASNIGLSGIIGGGIGAGVGAVSPLWDATVGKRVRGLLNDVTNEANVAADVAANGGARAGEASALAPNKLQGDMVEELAGGLKPNADEISAAAGRHGIKPSVGTLSNSQFIGRMEDGLIKRPTIFGEKAAKETEEIWQKTSKVAEKTLNEATTKTESQVGREIKQGLQEELDKELKPIEASYEKLKPHMKAMEVSDGLKQTAAQNIMGHELATIAPDSEASKLATRIGKEIQGLGTVDQVKTYRTLINERITKAARAGGEELPILYAAKRELTALREAAIEDATRKTGIGRGASSISGETIQSLREADSLYRNYKTKLQDVGREAGLGKLGSARQLLEKFKNLPDEAFAKKLFDAGDINQLNYFKEHFPKQFEQARAYKLKEILEKSIDEGQGKNGKFSVGKYLRQLSDTQMNPETREILMGSKLQDYKDVKTLFQALPENYNPSGTASAHAFGHMFSLQGLADNAADAVKYAVLKGLPHLQQAAGAESSKATGLATMAALASGKEPSSAGFKAAVDYIVRTLKGETMVNKATDAIFKAGKEVLPSKFIPDEKRLDKLDKKVQELHANMSPLFDAGGDVGHYMGAHAEAIGGLAGNAVAYLHTLRPDNTPKNPLDAEIPPSKFQQENYRNALKIAESPLTVLEQVKDGSIDPDDVTHLAQIYPALYQKLSAKLMDGIMTAKSDGEDIPYKTRMGLSLFLGQPLDSTMTPESMQAIQMAQQPPQSQQPPPGQGGGGGHSSLKDMGKLASASQTPDQARVRDKMNG